MVAYVKDEKINLNVMTMALKYVVGCEILGLDESLSKVNALIMCFPKHANMGHPKKKSLRKPQVCVHYDCLNRCTKIYNMAQTI
jgi:hypothetical protein